MSELRCHDVGINLFITFRPKAAAVCNSPLRGCANPRWGGRGSSIRVNSTGASEVLAPIPSCVLQELTVVGPPDDVSEVKGLDDSF